MVRSRSLTRRCHCRSVGANAWATARRALGFAQGSQTRYVSARFSDTLLSADSRRSTTPKPRSGNHPTRGRSTFWDLLTTGDDPSKAHGWSNEGGRRADSSVRWQRCRSGAEDICTFRSRNSTRSSRKSCEATTGTTGSLATFPASSISERKCERSGDAGSLGDAEMATSDGQSSIAWRSVTVFRPLGWSTACGAA